MDRPADRCRCFRCTGQDPAARARESSAPARPGPGATWRVQAVRGPAVQGYSWQGLVGMVGNGGIPRAQPRGGEVAREHAASTDPALHFQPGLMALQYMLDDRQPQTGTAAG